MTSFVARSRSEVSAPGRSHRGRTALVVLGVLLVAALVPVASALGFFGSRTYLVLTQDPAELRPYGGFIGAYGEAVVEFGRVQSLSFGDPKDLDVPDDDRHLYAASDSPDFSVAARSIADVYGGLTDNSPDAVIALDPSAAAGLLNLTGPLQVSGEAEEVTASNLLELVLKHTQNFEDPDANRKEFVYDVGLELAARLRSLPITSWPAVVGALGQAADARHLQVFFSDPIIGSLIHARGWDGAYPPPTDDFLAVVDSNVGYNKANLVTDQALDYKVQIGSDGATSATLTIGYQNRGTSGLSFPTESLPYVNQAAYGADVDVYVPLGAERLDSGGADDPDPDLGRKVFEEQVSVPSESSRTVVVSYRLPARHVDGQRIRYELFVRKQASTGAVPFSLSVTGPEGWRASGGSGSVWKAQSTLLTDQRFMVEFESPPSGG